MVCLGSDTTFFSVFLLVSVAANAGAEIIECINVVWSE